MDKNKQADIIRKRNAKLTKQLEEVNTGLELDRFINGESYQRAKNLITDMELIKKKWITALDNLYEKQAEYDRLIGEVKDLRKRMKMK